MADEHPRDRWMRHYGYDQTVQKFRKYRGDQNGTVGRIIADFCDEWQKIRSVLADWECSYQLAQMLPIPWRVWAMRLREEMRWTKRRTQYPAINFITFADRLFYQWLSENMPPYDLGDFRAARDIRRAEAAAAEIVENEEAEEDPIVRLGDPPVVELLAPVIQSGTHDAEAGSSRVRVSSEDPPQFDGRRIHRRVGMRTGCWMGRFRFQISDVATLGSDSEGDDEEEETSQVVLVSQSGTATGETGVRAGAGQPDEDGHTTDWTDDELIHLEPAPFSGAAPQRG